MDSSAFTVEAIRLLIYVAWSDGKIAPEEYDYILRLAKRRNLPEEEMKNLEASVRDPAQVVRPNIEALRPLREEILAEVQGLIMADDDVDDAEVEVLHRVASLLAD